MLVICKQKHLTYFVYLANNSWCYFWEAEVRVRHVTTVYLPQADTKTVHITFPIIWVAIENLPHAKKLVISLDAQCLRSEMISEPFPKQSQTKNWKRETLIDTKAKHHVQTHPKVQVESIRLLFPCNTAKNAKTHKLGSYEQPRIS